MSVQEVTPSIDPEQLLAGAQFIDAYRIAVEGSALNARTAAIKMFARAPRWIEALLNLRNLIVAPLGVKTSGDRSVYTLRRSAAGIPAATAAVRRAPVDVPAQKSM